MYKILGLATIAALLAACNERPGLDDTTAVVTPTTVDEVITIDVDSDDPEEEQEPIEVVVSGRTLTIGAISDVSFDGSELFLNIPLDGTGGIEAYDSAGDVGDTGYQKYIIQQGDLTRSFIALAGRSTDGSVTAVVALDGGQFNRFFGGASVIQDGFTAPADGLVQYTGDYVGLINLGIIDGSTGAPGLFIPAEGMQIDGQVLITADFNPARLVEGGIANRVLNYLTEPSGQIEEIALADVVLINTQLRDTGLFAGSVENKNIEDVAIGSYSGVFGGNEAAFVGGTVALDERTLTGRDGDAQTRIDAITAGQNMDNIQEFGIFVLGACPDGGCILSQPN